MSVPHIGSSLEPVAHPTGRLERLRGHLRATLRPDDPVARALTAGTAVAAFGSGVFYAVSTLLFVRALGLSSTTVGLGLTVAGVVAVVTSLCAGFLADLIGARRLIIGATAGQGLALAGYSIVGSVPVFMVVASLAVGLRSAAGAGRSALLARCFTGPDRVQVRARLRVVTNVSIGLGTTVAAAALLVDTAAVYRASVLLVGLFTLASVVPLWRVRRWAPQAPLDVRVPARRPGPPRWSPTARRSRAAGPDVAGPDAAGPDAAEPEASRPAPGADLRRGPSPLRDGRYLTAVGLTTVVAMQFGVGQIGVPLWITTRTDAPPVTVAALFVLNTIVVALLQVTAARGTHQLRVAGVTMRRAGLTLALACVLYASAALGGPVLAMSVLLIAGFLHAMAEIWAEAAGWGMAFELADQRSAGAYQGLSQTGYSVASMAAPLVVTVTTVAHGAAGWLVLGGLFALAGTLTWVFASRLSDVEQPGQDGGTAGAATVDSCPSGRGAGREAPAPAQ